MEKAATVGIGLATIRAQADGTLIRIPETSELYLDRAVKRSVARLRSIKLAYADLQRADLIYANDPPLARQISEAKEFFVEVEFECRKQWNYLWSKGKIDTVLGEPEGWLEAALEDLDCGYTAKWGNDWQGPLNNVNGVADSLDEEPPEILPGQYRRRLRFAIMEWLKSKLDVLRYQMQIERAAKTLSDFGADALETMDCEGAEPPPSAICSKVRLSELLQRFSVPARSRIELGISALNFKGLKAWEKKRWGRGWRRVSMHVKGSSGYCQPFTVGAFHLLMREARKDKRFDREMVECVIPEIVLLVAVHFGWVVDASPSVATLTDALHGVIGLDGLFVASAVAADRVKPRIFTTVRPHVSQTPTAQKKVGRKVSNPQTDAERGEMKRHVRAQLDGYFGVHWPLFSVMIEHFEVDDKCFRDFRNGRFGKTNPTAKAVARVMKKNGGKYPALVTRPFARTLHPIAR